MVLDIFAQLQSDCIPTTPIILITVKLDTEYQWKCSSGNTEFCKKMLKCELVFKEYV